MANKSFIIQYLIKARDLFTPEADQVKKAAKKMGDEVERTGGKFSQFSEKTKQALKKVRAAASRASQQFKEMSNSVKRAGQKMSLTVSTPLALLAVSLKNAARDAEEVESKFATVFKNVSQGAEASAKNLVANYGLSSTKSKQLLSDTGDLLTGFGFSQKAALDLSSQVQELAVDLASFTNFSGDAQGASEALTKALLGERESLKSLGIAISEKNVKTEIFRLMEQGQTFDTLQQAKAQATLSLAVKQSGNALGDFARTSGGLANQERILLARLDDLKKSFGKILLPIALKVTKAIQGLTARLEAMSPRMKEIILIAGGILIALGPVLIALGSFGLLIPGIVTAFTSLGTGVVAAFGPIGLIVGGVAAAAFVVIANWQKVKTFFKGFATGVSNALGPTARKLISDFKEAAAIVVEFFGSDSEAAQSLTDFANLGNLIGDVVGSTLDFIIRGISGVGAIIGQVIAAVTTLDFSNFDVDAIKAEFLGPDAQPILQRSRVDVGLQVGLDEGLTLLQPPGLAPSPNRPDSVGFGVLAP